MKRRTRSRTRTLATAATAVPSLAVLGLVLLALLAGPAGAGDEADGTGRAGESAAEQAFRAGWWAETSEGKLDRALEHYAEALAADGPAAVRARALYRMGVVLQRIGRTQDAIRALERLAKEHSSETDLQMKAKARLEEWTAVDLATNFDEWYRRYQYSPEFQARIIELVLTLSNSSHTDATHAATDELLTIGAPAIPALRAHIRSSNEMFRRRVVTILMLLGELPDAVTLLEAGDWGVHQKSWALLLAAPEARKATLLEELEGREDADVLRLVLGPPSGWADAVLEARSSSLLYAILDRGVDAELASQLKSIVGHEPELGGTLEVDVARALRTLGLVTDDELLEWLVRGSWHVAHYVARVLAAGEIQREAAVKAVVARMNDLVPTDRLLEELFQALVATLGDEPSIFRMDDAVKAIERVWSGKRIVLPTRSNLNGMEAGVTPARVDRLHQEIVGRAKDPDLVRTAMKRWFEAHQGQPLTARQMLAWAEAPLDPENRRSAAEYAGYSATNETIDELLAAVGDMEPPEAEKLWSGLTSHRALQGLPWVDERLLELLSVAEPGTVTALRAIQRFLGTLFAEQHRVEQLVRLSLEVPSRVPSFVTRLVPNDLRGARRIRTLIADGFPVAWRDGNLEVKQALLETLTPFLYELDEEDDLSRFFHEQLRATLATPEAEDERALERKIKREMLFRLPTIDLEDIEAVYDLSVPADAAAAMNAVRAQHLFLSEELYATLEAVRQAEDANARAAFWKHWGNVEDVALRRRILRDQAEDPDAHQRARALSGLMGFRNGQDVVIFRQALRDDAARVRVTAAQALSAVYDKQAIKALVRALEDDDPLVRDTVLSTLDVIKAIEKKKEYWRHAVRSDGTMPADD